jgi:hypothetical protein
VQSLDASWAAASSRADRRGRRTPRLRATSVLLGSLACATARGLAALVDTADGLDPASARARGVELGQLLWVRCGGDLRVAVQAADVIVRGGGFEVVAVDLGDLPPWRLARMPAAALVRLQRAVEGTPAALVFAGVRRVAGSLAATAVALSPARPCWEVGGPGLLAGLLTEARLAHCAQRPRANHVGGRLAPSLGARVGPALRRALVQSDPDLARPPGCRARDPDDADGG